MTKLGPGGTIAYGAAVDAMDIERRAGIDPAGWLTRLVRAVIQAGIAAEGLQYLVPRVTDRITTADGGVDASLSVELEISPLRTAGLVNHGRTVYQIKWRTKREGIVDAARGELTKLKDRDHLPDYYVFVTNVGLTIPEHERIAAELRNGCDEFPADRIVILGASELADKVNDDPRIRVAHFDVGVGLCTLESAQQMAERRYGYTDRSPKLSNREAEIAAIRQFLLDPRRRVLVVHGPQGVGKSRAVREALASTPDQVICASDVPAQPAGLIQVLDESPKPAVLVVDDAEAEADTVLRKGLEAARLKTIVIAPWRTGAPGAINLAIDPLGAEDADKFLGGIFPDMPWSQRGWLYEQFGGLPGLLLYGAEALRTGIGPDPLREPIYDDVLQAYETRMTLGLGLASAALEVLSVLPRFSLGETGGAADLRRICGALGLDYSVVGRSFETLRARNLVDLAGFRDDGFFRVAPPLLGRRIAKRVLQGIAGVLTSLYAEMSAPGKAQLVRRIAELESERAFHPFLRWLLWEAGLFDDVGSLAAHAATIRALAEAIPSPTARQLRGLLERVELQELRDGLTQKGRREVVYALERLVHREDTFDEAARSLLRLAAAENETWGNNATGIFGDVFHWKHPDIPKDARLRAELLVSLGGSREAIERRVSAKAARHCLEPQFTVIAHQGEAVAPPQAGWRATIWGDVHDAVRPVVELLKRFTGDTDEGVRNEAIVGLARGVRGILEVGLLDEAIDALEFLARLQLTGGQRSGLVDGVTFLVTDLERFRAAAKEETWKEEVEAGLTRGRDLFRLLTEGNFRARFLHWLGPSPMRAHRLMGEPADHEEIVKQGENLAAEVLREPSLFEADLQEWIAHGDAHNAGYFVYALGCQDQGRAWLPALESRLSDTNGVGALGTYAAGWASVAPQAAERYLDSLVSRGGRWSEAAVDATMRLPGSPRGATRIVRCVTEGGVNRVNTARRVAFGRWEQLSNVEFATLITSLRDSSADVDWELIEAVQRRWLQKTGAEDELVPLAKTLLMNTAGEPGHGHESYHWDSLAAAVATRDVNAGFELLFTHLELGDAGQGVSIAYHRRQLVEALSALDRPRIVHALLDRALGPEGWQIQLELPALLNPATDTGSLLEYSKGRGVEAARLISRNLDAAHPEFWSLVPALLVQWGSDSEVRAGMLHSMTWIRGVYSGKADTLRPRLKPLEGLLTHGQPLVREIAREAKRILLDEMRDEE